MGKIEEKVRVVGSRFEIEEKLLRYRENLILLNRKGEKKFGYPLKGDVTLSGDGGCIIMYIVGRYQGEGKQVSIFVQSLF